MILYYYLLVNSFFVITMTLQNVNDKLLLSSYIYCKALDFELNHPSGSFKDRVTYFVGCRAYEVVIHFFLKNL